MSRLVDWLRHPVTAAVIAVMVVAAGIGALTRVAAANVMMVGISHVVAGSDEHGLLLAMSTSPWRSRSAADRRRDDALVLAALRAHTTCGEVAHNGAPSARVVAALRGRCAWSAGDEHLAARMWRGSAVVNDLVRLAAFDKAHGEMNAAAEEYREALTADPASIEALLGLGDLHDRTGDWRAAASLYDRAIRSAPADPGPYAAKALLLVKRLGLVNPETENAVGLAIRVGARDPLQRAKGPLAWLYTDQALLDIRAGQPRLAIDSARKAIRLDATIDYAHFFLGEALRMDGDPRGAIVELNRALDLGLRNEGVRYSLALSYLDSGDIPNALRERDAFRRMCPTCDVRAFDERIRRAGRAKG